MDVYSPWDIRGGSSVHESKNLGKERGLRVIR